MFKKMFPLKSIRAHAFFALVFSLLLSACASNASNNNNNNLVTETVESNEVLSVDEQIKQNCENAMTKDPTHNPIVGKLWFVEAAAEYKNEFYELTAQEISQADVLVCSQGNQVEEEQCLYLETTIAFVSKNAGEVFEKETFSQQFPAECPPAASYPNGSYDSVVAWMRSHWHVSNLVDATPVPPPVSDLTLEDVDDLIESFCTDHRDEISLEAKFGGKLWLANSSRVDDLNLPSNMITFKASAADILVCFSTSEVRVKSCTYNTVLEQNKIVPFERLDTIVEVFDLYSELLLGRKTFAGSPPVNLNCPESIKVDSLTGLLASDDAAKFRGEKVNSEEIKNWLIENWTEASTSPKPSFEYVQHGYFSGLQVNHITQDADGYLWVSSSNGLYKFNPAGQTSEWFVYSIESGGLPSYFSSNTVHVALPLDDGLWVNDDYFDGKSWTSFTVGGFSNLAKVDGSGTIWSTGGIWNGNDFDEFRDENNESLGIITTILVQDDDIWVGTDREFIRYENKQPSTQVTLDSPRAQYWANYQGGSILVCTNDKVIKITDNNEEIFLDILGSWHVQSMLTVGDKIFILTTTDGLFYFDGTNWYHINRLDGLPVDGGDVLYVDSYGTVWIGGNGLISFLP